MPKEPGSDKTVLVKRMTLKLTDDAGKQLGGIDEVEFHVKAEQGTRIKVITRHGVEGWLERNDVVPVEDAINYFTGRAQLNNADFFAYSMRAWALRLKGEIDASIKESTDLLGVDAKNQLAYINRASPSRTRRTLTRPSPISAWRSSSIRRTPCPFTRGTVYHDKQDFDKAIADYQRGAQARSQVHLRLLQPRHRLA